MTFKRSLALAALLAIGLSSTTGFAHRDPEEPLTDAAMARKTLWMGLTVAGYFQWVTRIAPEVRSQLSSKVSSNEQVLTTFMDAVAAGLFVTKLKNYFECVSEYTWNNVGQPLANQLPEPLRSTLCD